MVEFSDSIKRQLELQLSQKEIEELFEDGEPHQLLFLNAIFVDGQSLTTTAFQPLIVEGVSSDYKGFGEQLDSVMKGLSKVYQDIVYRDLLATRALARAALVFAYEMGSMKPADPVPAAMEKAFRLIGAAGGVPVEILENSTLLPEKLADDFRAYLEETPIPDLKDAFGSDKKETV